MEYLPCTLHILVDLYSNLYNNSHFTPCTTVIVWFWQTISVQDDANHCHYSGIMHAVDSSPSVLIVLRASHTALLHFWSNLSQRHLQSVLHTLSLKNHKIISRAAYNLQKVYQFEKNNLPGVQSLPNKQISPVRGRIRGSKIIDGKIT